MHDYHTVVTIAKKGAAQTQHRRERLFARAFCFLFHRKPIVLHTDRRFHRKGRSKDGATAYPTQVRTAWALSLGCPEGGNSAQSETREDTHFASVKTIWALPSLSPLLSFFSVALLLPRKVFGLFRLTVR